MQRIAVIRRNGFGDLLCAMPLCSYLKRKHPEAELTLFVEERNRALTPYLREYHDHVVSLTRFKPRAVLQTLLQRRKAWDLAVSGKTTPMKFNNRLLWALGAKQRVAYCDPGTPQSLVNFQHRVEPERQSGDHQALRALQLCAPELESLPQELYPRLRIPKDLAKAYGPAARSAVSFGDEELPLLLVSISNNRKHSCAMSVERWAHLLESAAAQQPFRVLISCTAEDLDLAHELQQRLSIECRACPTPDFHSFIALIHAVDACLLGEGGTMHLAAALDKPQVDLFGHTCPVQWGPLSARARIFSSPRSIDEISDAEIIEATAYMIAMLPSRQLLV